MARRTTKKKDLTPEEKLAQALVPVAEWPYEVPENWCCISLAGATTRIKRGKAPKYTQESKTLVFAQKCNQKDGAISMEKAKFLSAEMLPKISEDEFLQDKDIVINSTGTGTLGRVGLFRVEYAHPYKKVLPDSHITVVRPSCFTISEYLFLFLKSKKDYLETKGVGTTNQKELRPDSIEELVFPLPPLPEQHRIVARTESLFAKLDEAKEKAQAVVDGFEERKAAILHKAFTGELTKKWREEKGISKDSWTTDSLGRFGTLERGRSKHRPRNDPSLFNGPYPFIQTGDVASSGRYVTSHKQSLSEKGLLQSRMFPKGTLCITIAANIGNTSILSYDCCFPDSVVGFTPNAGVLSEYIYYLFNTIQQELEANAPATAQKNINLKVLNGTVVTVPKTEEQQEIVRILDSLLEKQQQAKSSAEQVLDQIDTMKKAILARAFRGELGTNDPAEESAVELVKSVLEH